MRYGDNVKRTRQFLHEAGPVIPLVRGVSLLLLLCPGRALSQVAAETPGSIRGAPTPAAAPPLYQRFREPRGGAVSMIYGVGEIGQTPAQTAPQRPQRVSVHPSCATPPAPEQAQPFSLFMWMKKQQAVDLGLIFRGPDGAERPFLGEDALIWRSGATATCPSTDGTLTVVYGWEWDVGVVVERTAATRGAETFQALHTLTPPAPVLAFGESVNGTAGQGSGLQQALARLWVDWQGDPAGHLSQTFLNHFEDARKAASTDGQQPGAGQALGAFLKR